MYKNKIIGIMIAAIIALASFIIHFANEGLMFDKTKWLLGGFAAIMIAAIYVWKVLDIMMNEEIKKIFFHKIPLEKLVIPEGDLESGEFLIFSKGKEYYFGELASSQLEIAIKLKKGLDCGLSLDEVIDKLNCNKDGFLMESSEMNLDTEEIIFMINYKQFRKII